MTQRRTDNTLFYTIVALVFFGVVMIFSASSAVAETRYKLEMTHFLKQQLLWLALGIPVLIIFKRLEYTELNKAQWAFGAVGIVVMLQVLAIIIDPKLHRLSCRFLGTKPDPTSTQFVSEGQSRQRQQKRNEKPPHDAACV